MLVYGGKGALGSAIVSFFRSKNWWVASMDLLVNEEATTNIVLSKTESWTDQSEEVTEKVRNILDGQKVDAILCVAGGWAGGNAASKDLVKNADLMWKQSVWTSTIAAGLAAEYLENGGLLALSGAKAALEGTSGMIGYGMAKGAIHQLTKSLAQEGSGIPSESHVLSILPVTLNTPMNRKSMPNADFRQWTPLEFVANLFYEWTTNKESRPANGSLLQLITKDEETDVIAA